MKGHPGEVYLFTVKSKELAHDRLFPRVVWKARIMHCVAVADDEMLSVKTTYLLEKQY